MYGKMSSDRNRGESSCDFESESKRHEEFREIGEDENVD